MRQNISNVSYEDTDCTNVQNRILHLLDHLTLQDTHLLLISVLDLQLHFLCVVDVYGAYVYDVDIYGEFLYIFRFS